MLKRVLVASALFACTAGSASAQAVPMPVRQPAIDSVRTDSVRTASAHRDSVRRDSTKVKELIKWADEDSVMKALLQRQNYEGTKYQGDK
ncbi:MAG: hypothetical protein H0W63_08050, partial [Gemmatimonadaceae bacterium]|nr:hypothetical protein [Gemmatimonadaceae bacterium]